MVRLLEKRKRKGNLLVTFTVASFGLHLLTLLLLIIQGLTIRQLSVQKPPTFVQLIDGKPVNNRDELQQKPEAISEFVSKTMISMFNWSGKLPAQNINQATNPKKDLGISIKTPQGGSKKVTTSSWISSFAFSEDFRKGFLGTVAELTPPEVFSSNSSQAILAELNITRTYPPQQIEPGKWRIGIVANLVQKRGDEKQIVTPFNKDIFVQAIDSFDYPITDNLTDLQQAIYATRSDKLEIYEIRELCLTDRYDNLATDGFNRCQNRR
ncbi:hypothetical protein [Rivularia sp. UHCC 0363]|uniref:hypothetical protein n=1 Tax=Rivularia sp. UHCC 0363 TaxID=3110244 RepID=UPI002B20A3CF|nr:hypothetical protein [Rivularia sp. UHCC 0363]MEA5596077.1 hypothetical protein [Rivularia sp. UHCC 0363]